eukprot:TRINITY_DN67115_c7_g4_i1.p1 TRINITY_DN67115_c7_g4~~TRINITY_DN67115_c7_g4_i1.p1  ORF type:complete len:330 (+),score=-17.92 TRINITY_DN67115_c7_g4_i1:44-1033(+)
MSCMSVSLEDLRRCCAELKLPNKGKRETLCALIEDELDDLTVVQLKSCLKIFGLNMQGLKQDLYQRLANIMRKANSAKREREDNEKLIECPVCMETMSPPIYQCHAGHLLCQTCYPKLPTCPTCRATLNQSNPIRSRVSEAIAANVAVSCPFAGCAHTTTADKINEHKTSCPCRPLPCPKCQQEHDTAAKLANHFETAHSRKTDLLQIHTSKITFTLSPDQKKTTGGETWEKVFPTPTGRYYWFKMRTTYDRHLEVTNMLQFAHKDRSTGCVAATVNCGPYAFSYRGPPQEIGREAPDPLLRVTSSPEFVSDRVSSDGLLTEFSFPIGE